ncbi:M13 family metallopeptidase [Halosquirtibacter xylanolyticus]|uniref:M13 family metallopeptidase n=1 Tax=Halosquirtibacter xylanolyticus TaxID=3374599 RepID=UPI00374A631D|nr:M13 family metallopeptidase [Prolixibacteraceae bacterium]
MNRRINFGITCLGLSLTLTMGACSMGTSKKENKITPAINVADLDLKANPRDDFNAYSNGGWKASHPIPSDRSRYGAFDALGDLAQEQVKSLFDEIAKGQYEDGTDGSKIATFYNLGMDVTKIDMDGIQPIESYLNAIDVVSNKSELLDQFALFHRHFINPGFAFYASSDMKNSNYVIGHLCQSGLGLPDRDYYTDEGEQAEKIRSEYKVHLIKMFQLLGQSANEAEKTAESVYGVEDMLARQMMTRLEQRSPENVYNMFDLPGLKKLAPQIDWDAYFKSLGIDDVKELNIDQPEYLAFFAEKFDTLELDAWKNYLKWNLINDLASSLSTQFDQQNFAFYGKVLSGKEQQLPRWKRVQRMVDGSLSEAIGQMYVAKYFPPEAKQRMVDLVGNLRLSLKERIKGLEWMGAETKDKALAKLAAINVKVGYPDQWKDYTDLVIKNDSYVQNVIRSSEFGFMENKKKLYKPVDKKEWGMSPQTVNAYYSPNMNEIVFPAAILQPPFFNMSADDAVNYGAIGVVIGHEMTHGFDDEGRKYDKDGNFNDWWTVEDAKRFTKRANILVEQYNSFIVADSVHANGRLTLGENIADLGGVNISYQAFQKVKKNDNKIDGFTPNQRFFLAYAHVWASNTRKAEKLRRTKTDPHSLGKYRTNGILRNVPEFYIAFEVKDGDKMYLPEDQRAIIW